MNDQPTPARHRVAQHIDARVGEHALAPRLQLIDSRGLHGWSTDLSCVVDSRAEQEKLGDHRKPHGCEGWSQDPTRPQRWCMSDGWSIGFPGQNLNATEFSGKNPIFSKWSKQENLQLNQLKHGTAWHRRSFSFCPHSRTLSNFCKSHSTQVTCPRSDSPAAGWAKPTRSWRPYRFWDISWSVDLHGIIYFLEFPDLDILESTNPI